MEDIKDEVRKLLHITPEIIEEVRKEANISNKEDREKAIEIIAEWVKQQEHFIKKEYNKGYYERCLITCKGSIELVKKQIDKMCTFRTLMPEYFSCAYVLKSKAAPLLDIGYFAVLPKQTKDHYRVTMMKLKPDVLLMPDSAVLFFQSLVFIAEALKNNDYNLGSVLVLDVQNDGSISDLVRKFNVFEVARSYPIISEGYGGRIKGVVFITSSKLIEGFLAVIKPLLSQKLASRLHVLTSRVRLAELIEPAEILPVEYGGKEKSLETSTRDLLEFASSTQFVEVLEEMNAARTDESKRLNDFYQNQYTGVPGTFRTINID